MWVCWYRMFSNKIWNSVADCSLNECPCWKISKVSFTALDKRWFSVVNTQHTHTKNIGLKENVIFISMSLFLLLLLFIGFLFCIVFCITKMRHNWIYVQKFFRWCSWTWSEYEYSINCRQSVHCMPMLHLLPFLLLFFAAAAVNLKLNEPWTFVVLTVENAKRWDTTII